MRIPRIYHPELITSQAAKSRFAKMPLTISGAYCAWAQARRYSSLTVANQILTPKLPAPIKKRAVKVLRGEIDDRESPLHIHLGQVMSRGEKWNLRFRNPSNSV